VSEYYIHARTPILHKCTVCGCLWNGSPDNILRGYGCPECNLSKGEKEIKSYLIHHHINYIPQYTFHDCKNIHVLPFDFYLPDYNLCIEYDGIQHFKPIEYFGGEATFKETVMRDSIKTNYCILNNIYLLRIRYDTNVTEELDRYFNNIKLIEEAI
jgi:very-short-patch-repair endonuclease